MWNYATYRWPDQAAWLAALAAAGWSEGAPPGVDLLVTGTLYEAPVDDETPGAPLPGWHVAAAFRAVPPLAWAAMEVDPPEGMPVLGRAQVPASVTNFQARAALMQMPSGTPGVSLFAVIDGALRAGREGGAEGAIAWQAWEQANDFYRDGALINTMAGQFGLGGAQIDALFRSAAAIAA
jgi:hypothetical protein